MHTDDIFFTCVLGDNTPNDLRDAESGLGTPTPHVKYIPGGHPHLPQIIDPYCNEGEQLLESCIEMRFRPKNREEKELQGENGALDTETSRFMGRARSARPENGRKVENGRKMKKNNETNIQNYGIFDLTETATF